MAAARRRREKRLPGAAPMRPRWRLIVVSLAAAAALAAAGWAVRAPLRRWQVERQYEKAQELAAQGEEAAAASALAGVLQRDPAHPAARRALAGVELRRGRIEQAFLHLVSYTELAPEDAWGFIELADLEANVGQPIDAEAALGHALEAEPSRPRLFARRAELRLRLGRFRGALADAESAVRQDSHDVEGWIALCRATSRLRGRAAADEALRKAIAAAGADPRLVSLSQKAPPAEPPHPPSRRARPGQAENWPGDLGETVRRFLDCVHRGDWSGAHAVVRSAREKYPGTMFAPWLEGIADLAEGLLPQAEESLLGALAVSPRSHRVITNLIGVWSRQRGPGYTAERLSRLSEEDPSFTYPVPIAAHAWLEGSQPAKAEATVRRLFTLLPGSPVPDREMADFFLAVDRASDALSTCESGLLKFPRDPELETLLARAALLLGDRERAAQAYEDAVAARPDAQVPAAQLARLLAARKDEASRARALALVHELSLDQPSDPEVLAAIGAVLLDPGGDAASARLWLEAARQAAPDEPGVRYQLALAYARSGEKALAREELGAALRSGKAFPEESDARRLSIELGTRP